MRSRLWIALSLLVIAATALSACNGAAPAAGVDNPAPGSQPSGFPAPGLEDVLDARYQTFLGGMLQWGALTRAALSEMLGREPPPFVLDVRDPTEVEETGHIEGAVLIPLRRLAQHTDLLPSFDTPIVVYCGTGHRCTIAMTVLEALGWETVYSLKEGSFGGWVEAGYAVVPGLPPAAEPRAAAAPDAALLAHFDAVLQAFPESWGAVSAPQLARALVERPDLILIDARAEQETASVGSIESPHRIAIPLAELTNRRAEWPTDRAAVIVIYSGTGHRCTIAMTILRSYGYTNVHILHGGLRAWVSAGFPVATRP